MPSSLIRIALGLWLGSLVFGFIGHSSEAVAQQISAPKLDPCFVNQPSKSISANSMDFHTWSELLAKYVDADGRVRYRAWCEDADDRRSVQELLKRVAEVDPSRIVEPFERQAFWINLYNLLALEIRLREFEKRQPQPNNIWKDVFVHVGSKSYALDDIEHSILRPMKQPLVHFGLHCGALSCPKLPAQALDSKDLESTLQTAAQTFLKQPNAVRWDAEGGVLHLSKIFEWYRSDFGDSDQELITALMPYLSHGLQSELKGRVNTVKVEFLEYDWTLAATDSFKADTSEASTSDSSKEKPQDKKDSDQFPPEVEYWLTQQENYELGLKEADQLRQRLLARITVPIGSKPSDHTYADRIASVVQSFQKQAEQIDLSVPVSSFQVTSSRLIEQLDGRVSLGKEGGVFAAFDGKWFGLWDVHAVNHDWRPSRVHSPAKSYSRLGLQVNADQYAWIHNGFGWNYLVREAASEKLPFVLGQVYYLNANDLKKIDARKPHVGFADLPDEPDQAIHRLVWITEQEIFLEEVFPHEQPDETYYAITGIFHQLLSDKPTVSNKFVQAKYTRRSSPRPAFRHMEWKPPRDFSP